MAIGDIWQLTLVGRIQGQVCENVFHYRVTADADDPALFQGLFNFGSDQLCTLAAGFQADTFVWTSIRGQKIWPLPVRVAHDGIINIPGTNTEVALPSEVAFVITKTSFLAGRANRGRNYWTGITASSVDQVTGLFSNLFILAAAPLEEAVHLSVNSVPAGGILEPVIYHRNSHTATTIIAARSRETPRAQRRRQVGRGI